MSPLECGTLDYSFTCVSIPHVRHRDRRAPRGPHRPLCRVRCGTASARAEPALAALEQLTSGAGFDERNAVAIEQLRDPLRRTLEPLLADALSPNVMVTECRRRRRASR